VSPWRSLLPFGAGLILLALAALVLWQFGAARKAEGEARAAAEAAMRWQAALEAQTRQITALEAAAAAGERGDHRPCPHPREAAADHHPLARGGKDP